MASHDYALSSIDSTSFSVSLVDEGVNIGPQEQTRKQKDQNVTNKSEKLIFKQFKEDPNSSGSPEHTRRYLLVPPQYHVSSCKQLIDEHQNQKAIISPQKKIQVFIYDFWIISFEHIKYRHIILL